MKRKIVVVQDDKGLQNVFRMILDRAGYEIEIYGDGMPILNNEFELPDLFLLDKKLPGVDGISLCKFLKSQTYTRHVPVIIISSNIGFGRSALTAGAAAFVENPYEIRGLLRIIEDHILANEPEFTNPDFKSPNRSHYN